MLDYAAIARLFPGKPKPAKLGPFASLADLKQDLGAQSNRTAGQTASGCTSCEFSIQSDALIPLIRPARGPYSKGGAQDLPASFLKDWIDLVDDDEDPSEPGFWQEKRGTRHPQATVNTISGIEDAEIRKRVQRAAARAIILCIEQVDGYKYKIGNKWEGKDEGGHRFSYVCQDSVQNTARNAEGFVQTAAIPFVRGRKGARKPTYDCKGCVAIKFNSSTRLVEIHYKHCAIHKPVMERNSSMVVAAIGRLAKEPSASPEDSVGGHTEDSVLDPALREQVPQPKTTSSTVVPAPARKERPLKRKRAIEHATNQTFPQQNPDQLSTPVHQAELSNSQLQPAKRRSKSSTMHVPTPPVGVQYDIPGFMRLLSPPRSLPPAPASMHIPHSPQKTAYGHRHKTPSQRQQSSLPANGSTGTSQRSRTARQPPQKQQMTPMTCQYTVPEGPGTATQATPQHTTPMTCQYSVPFESPPTSARFKLSKPSAEIQLQTPSLFQLMRSTTPGEIEDSPYRTPLIPASRPKERPQTSGATIEISRGQENQPPHELLQLAKFGKRATNGESGVDAESGRDPRPGPPRPHPPRPPVQPPPESTLTASAVSARIQTAQGQAKQYDDRRMRDKWGFRSFRIRPS